MATTGMQEGLDLGDTKEQEPTANHPQRTGCGDL